MHYFCYIQKNQENKEVRICYLGLIIQHQEMTRNKENSCISTLLFIFSVGGVIFDQK